jgi:CBS domain-containing protein
LVRRRLIMTKKPFVLEEDESAWTVLRLFREHCISHAPVARGFYRNSLEVFKFSAKLPRLVTHQEKLDTDLKIKNDLLRFFELMTARKLGAILIQLPPKFLLEKDYQNSVSLSNPARRLRVCS